MCLTAVGLLRSIPDIARRYPNLQLLIDHLGLFTLDDQVDRLAMFPDLLALARFDNVAVKCTDAPSLSKEPYPFRPRVICTEYSRPSARSA